ncbi:MAG: hypothetical protein J6A11_02325 [Lachnospiraceae bacterium]|nr:hypothetical protein [Lachnospiraceae bacterium]
MDESISNISITLDENSRGMGEIVDSTTKFVQTLHEINSQIDSCDGIALQLQESLAQFQDR